jgi:hypothetical protein
MNQPVTLELEESKVRFTPDGKVAVVDAIGALSDADCPQCLWADLKRSHPQISRWCSGYRFSEEETVPVAGRRGWIRIQDLLLDHLIENGF